MAGSIPNTIEHRELSEPFNQVDTMLIFTDRILFNRLITTFNIGIVYDGKNQRIDEYVEDIGHYDMTVILNMQL